MASWEIPYQWKFFNSKIINQFNKRWIFQQAIVWVPEGNSYKWGEDTVQERFYNIV